MDAGINTFSEEDTKKIIDLRMGGRSYAYIAKRMSVTPFTIIEICHKANISMSKQKRDKMYKMLIKGETVGHIMDKIGISRTMVEFYCAHYNIAIKVVDTKDDDMRGKTPFSKRHFTRAEYIKTDSRGVEWRERDDGWVCLGKDLHELAIDAKIEKHKKTREKKESMLKYKNIYE